MRILMTVEYLGTNYCGWQRQNNTKNTIQQKIEDALEKLLNVDVCIFASGRTDVGVHAIGQTFHFDTQTSRNIQSYKHGLNHFLPNDIRIKSAKIVTEDFHARYSVIKKTYVYKFYTGEKCALLQDRATNIYYNIDIDLMNIACEKICGIHDFSCFMTSDTSVKTTVRTVYDCSIKKVYNESVSDFFELEISANGFLYNMVRNIMAFLLRVGSKKIDIDIIEKAYKSRSREYTKFIAPASGLYLKSVDY